MDMQRRRLLSRLSNAQKGPKARAGPVHSRDKKDVSVAVVQIKEAGRGAGPVWLCSRCQNSTFLLSEMGGLEQRSGVVCLML